MDTISAFTRGTERIAYRLSTEPHDMAALSAILSEASFEWQSGAKLLVCSFPSVANGIAETNRKLLPALLSMCDVISATPGQSLEEAFLSASANPQSRRQAAEVQR
jgi:hypothetical protein